ncbi:MAG: HDIG domain-containing protein [Spirochaetes bacterium]|nr:HDIG domain-containing protein [Spirochaetota bacterium]
MKEPNSRFAFYLMLIIIIISTAFLSLNVVGTTYNYNIGDIVKEDIRTTREIKYIIESESEMAKKRAADNVPLVFDKDQSILIDSLKKIERYFKYINRVLEENPPIGTEDRTFQLIALKDILPKNLTYSDRTLWNTLKAVNTNKMKITINRILIFIFDKGILEKPFLNPLDSNSQNATIRTINISEDTNEVSQRLDDIRTMDLIKKELPKICYSISKDKSRETINAIVDIVGMELEPNIFFNIEETKRRIDEKVKTVKPIMGILKKGQMITREGDTVTTESLYKIDVLNKNTASYNISYIIGIFLIQFIIMFISIFTSSGKENKALENKKVPIITFSLVLFFMIFTFFAPKMFNLQDSIYIFALFLPIPFVTMTISSLFSDKFLALLVSIFIIFYTFIISMGTFASLAITFSSTILGIIVIRDLERRTDFLRGGLIIGFINALIIIAIGLIDKFSAVIIFKNAGISFASGILNSILVLGIFPLYENVFGVTTRFKLLELSDLNAKIFKKMLIKAPGTYNHSLMVANMAEAACEAIGANPILARVGGYYHDIGKINNAKYFVENKSNSSDNTDMPPEDYAELIISHVETGVKLAKENKIPDSIIDFIREHHGTSTMTYFYHQALEMAESSGDTSITKEVFQYAGPKPKSRETAVVMIADSVEAASRSLQEPTSIKLEGLVKKIIYNKLNDGELENSHLNMSDLNLIQKSILRVLNGVFHTRLEYPEDEEIKKLEEKINTVSENNED